MKKLKYLFYHLEELESFKKDFNTVILTDIDGTISEIAQTPDEAFIKHDIKVTLEKVADKFRYAGVMTGRSVDNALKLVGSNKLLYIGNHGLEQYKNCEIITDPRVRDYVPLINELFKYMKVQFRGCDCVLLQDKKLSFTIHYRLCENDDRIRNKALDAIRNFKGSQYLKITEGRKIIEIRPPLGHDKGSVLQKFISDNNIKKIIYLGDDITDLDAFAKLGEMKAEGMVEAFTMAVLSSETPDDLKENADFYVKSVDDVHKFLKWLSDT